MSTPICGRGAHGFPHPVRGDDPSGLRGVGGDVRPPRRLRRGSAGLRGEPVLVPGRVARRRAPLPLRLVPVRVRRGRDEPGELTPLRRTAFPRFTSAGSLTATSISVRTRSPTRRHSKAGRSCSRGGPAITTSTGTSCTRAGWRRSRRPRRSSPGSRSRRCPKSRTSRSSWTVTGSDRATRSCTRTTASSRESTASSSTTSSS